VDRAAGHRGDDAADDVVLALTTRKSTAAITWSISSRNARYPCAAAVSRTVGARPFHSVRAVDLFGTHRSPSSGIDQPPGGWQSPINVRERTRSVDRARSGWRHGSAGPPFPFRSSTGPIPLAIRRRGGRRRLSLGDEIRTRSRECGGMSAPAPRVWRERKSRSASVLQRAAERGHYSPADGAAATRGPSCQQHARDVPRLAASVEHHAAIRRRSVEPDAGVPIVTVTPMVRAPLQARTNCRLRIHSPRYWASVPS